MILSVFWAAMLAVIGAAVLAPNPGLASAPSISQYELIMFLVAVAFVLTAVSLMVVLARRGYRDWSAWMPEAEIASTSFRDPRNGKESVPSAIPRSAAETQPSPAGYVTPARGAKPRPRSAAEPDRTLPDIDRLQKDLERIRHRIPRRRVGPRD